VSSAEHAVEMLSFENPRGGDCRYGMADVCVKPLEVETADRNQRIMQALFRIIGLRQPRPQAFCELKLTEIVLL
jgi:hypothetical protein